MAGNNDMLLSMCLLPIDGAMHKPRLGRSFHITTACENIKRPYCWEIIGTAVKIAMMKGSNKRMYCAGAPLTVTEDLLTTFNISLVVRGSVSETGVADEEEHKRYSVPKQKGIMRYAGFKEFLQKLHFSGEEHR